MKTLKRSLVGIVILVAMYECSAIAANIARGHRANAVIYAAILFVNTMFLGLYGLKRLIYNPLTGRASPTENQPKR